MAHYNQNSARPTSNGETVGGSEQNGIQYREETSLTLDSLKVMFDSVIDPEVVEMIWFDSQENGDVALAYLTEMSPLDEPVTQPVAKPIQTSWSNILGDDSSKSFTVNLGAKPKSTVKERHLMIDKIKEAVNCNQKVVVIMRGVPGSGKSFLAKQLEGDGVVLSTDDYFINCHGQYMFDRGRLPEAHEWNQKRADQHLKTGTNPVIIDNTNLEVWELQPYVVMALR